MKSRKAKLFAFGLAFTLLIVLMRIYFLQKAAIADLSGDFAVGENQIKIFSAIQEAEKSMLYGEQGLSMAFQQSLYELSVNGGYEPFNFPCGETGGYNIWRKNSTKDCYPDLDEIKERLAKITLDDLNNNFLSKNPYTKSKKPYKNKHEMFIEQKADKLIARAYALSPNYYNIMRSYGKPALLDFGWLVIDDPFADEIKAASGLYTYKPSFRKELEFDITDFEKAASTAKKLSSDIKGCIKQGKSKRECASKEWKKYSKLAKDCVGGVSNVYYSFVNHYELYLNSPKSDCVAYFTPSQQIDIKKEPNILESLLGLNSQTEIRIKITSQGQDTVISVDKVDFEYVFNVPGPYFTEFYNDPGNPSYIPSNREIEYILNYDKDGKLFKQELNFGSRIVDWDIAGNLMLYKETKDKLVFVDTDDYAEFNSVSACFPSAENAFNYCYDTGSKLMAYNAEDKSYDVQKAIIRFALSFP